MFRYVRFVPKDKKFSLPQYGVIKGFHFSAGNRQQIMVLEGSPFDHPLDDPNVREDVESIALSDVSLLPPVTPSKIVGIGLNYKDHAIEQGKPLPEVPYVFFKAPSAVIASGESIRINRHCTNVHYEGELAVVIGSREGQFCKNVSESDAPKFIAGFTMANDVTDRTIQKAELTFARAKGMDTFCPLGPTLVHGYDWNNRSIKTYVNGELKQSGTTADMIHSVPKLISFVSQFMTLYPGDVILTGTPKGVGQLKPGDRVKVEIEDLGVLENAVEHDN